MLTALLNFFYMHGYGIYIWSAYSCTIILLIIQWYLPWRRWRKYLRQYHE